MATQSSRVEHSQCGLLRETGQRVRRGMRGRVLDNKSVGDIPYGYRSYFDDPEYAASYCGRGPKPTKSIAIYEPEAVWVPRPPHPCRAMPAHDRLQLAPSRAPPCLASTAVR